MYIYVEISNSKNHIIRHILKSNPMQDPWLVKL
jgi:hypothetical protein